MAYSKISKDGRVCDLLENVEREKDILIASAKAIFTESIELVKKYDEKDVRKLRKKLKVQCKNLQAINCFFKLRFPDEDDDSSSSAASLELKPDDPNCINYAELLIGAFPVSPGDKRVMKVSCFDSVADFWLQLSNSTERHALSMTISDKYDSEELEINFNPIPGMTVVARTPTGTVRALVLERDRKERLFVRDLDSGKESYTSGKVLVPDVDLYWVPCQAVHCSLHQNDGLFCQNETISKSILLSHELAVTFMEKLTENQFSVTVSCNEVLKPKEVHPVDPVQATLRSPFGDVSPTTPRESPFSGPMESVIKSASTHPSSTNPVPARSVRSEITSSSMAPAEPTFQRTPYSHTTFPFTVPHVPVIVAKEKTPITHTTFPNTMPSALVKEIQETTPHSHTMFPNTVPHAPVKETQERTPHSHTTFPNTVPHAPVKEIQEKTPHSHTTFPNTVPHAPVKEIQEKTPHSHTTFPNTVPHAPVKETQERTPHSHTTFPNTVPHAPVIKAKEKTPFRQSAFQNVIPRQPIPQVQAKLHTSFPNSASQPTLTEAQPVTEKAVKKTMKFKFAPVITSETNGFFNTRIDPTLEEPLLDMDNITTSKLAAVNGESNSKSKMNLMKKGEQHKISDASTNIIMNDTNHPCLKPLPMLNGGHPPAIDSNCRDISISSASSISSTNIFREGNIFQVTVTHVESPSHICINIVNDETTSTKNLLQDMNRVYNHPSRPDFSADIGAHIAVHDKDADIWMRGHVTRLHCSDDLSIEVAVTADLIDIGNTITVSESECADLLPKFKHPAKLAHPIRLAKVYPVPPQTEWSRQMLDELKELLKHTPLYKLTVIGEGNDREIPAVTLSISSEDDDLLINDLLVSLDLAVAQLPEEQSVVDWEPVTTATELWNPEAPEFQPSSQSRSLSSFQPPEFPLFEFGATAAFEEVATEETAKSGRCSFQAEDIYFSESPPEECMTPMIDRKGWEGELKLLSHLVSSLLPVDSTVGPVPLDFDSEDEVEPCPEFTKSGKCDRPGCTKNHLLIHTGGSTVRPESVCLQPFTKLNLPEIGKSFQFRVTEVKSVNNMFVILSSENVSMAENPTGPGSIDDLVQKINLQSRTLKKMTTFPTVGEIVLARYDETDLFYRAIIIDTTTEESTRFTELEALERAEIEVLYVDYGNKSWVDMRNVRCIANEFLHLPFMAVEITIQDMVANKGCDQEAAQELYALTENTELSATCVKCENEQIIVKNVHYNNSLLSDVLKDLVITPGERELDDGSRCDVLQSK